MRHLRRPWPTELKMPLLVDGKLTIAAIDAALAVLESDGPASSMSRVEIIEWLRMHVRPAPHPPAPSTPPGTRGKRIRRRYETSMRRDPTLHRSEARAA